jgi:carbon-monoxide dehydrogenase small subunit
MAPRPPTPAMFELSIKVNGRDHREMVAADTLLVDFLREKLRLTGTHVGCDTTQCGCCTVHVDGSAIKSCTVLAAQTNGQSVTTIEGVAPSGELHPMQRAFIKHHALQCGFCTPGMIMMALAIARDEQEVTAENVRRQLHGNLCRCTGYLNIIDAVVAGSAAMRTAAS